MATGPIVRDGDFTGEAGEALTKFANVTIRSDGLLYLCDATEFAIGYVDRAYASGVKDVSVLKFAGRRRHAIASAAITVGDPVVVAADGKVASFAAVSVDEGGAATHTLDTEFQVLGIAVTAAAQDDDVIQVENLN